MTDVVEADTAEGFVASTTYTIAASLYSPKGRLIGRLERTWRGAATIGELSMMLISNSGERADLDQCRIEIRWRKDRSSQEDPSDHPQV